ncbi:MAG: outer membrane protein assembly factor BamA, partial [Deltaproteobacteria bacterium]|nr:outer membrane protein assembly factor BamA [Deltaproteobacteria bacterium]
HSGSDISASRRNLMESLASGLHSSGAEITGVEATKELALTKGVKEFGVEEAERAAEAAEADFAVLGSMTRAGSTTDVDLRVLDLKTKEIIAFYYRSSASTADLAAKMRETAVEMLRKMTEVSSARPAVRSGIVDRIEVAGNRRVDAAAILKKITAKKGAPYSPDDVREDIRAVYSTGYFDDVSAGLTDTASGKTLTFTVKEMPFIKKIAFRGNSELKEEKLKEAVTLKENAALDRTALAENAAKIKALYAEDGFYLAEVLPVIESDGIEATVAFKISEGPEVKVKRITVIGTKFFSGEKIKGLMSTNEKGLFSFVTQSGKFSEFIFQNDLAVIMGYYYDRGFINADILDHRVLLSEDKQWFYITIAVSEGDQYRVGEIDITGDMLATKKELLEKLKIVTGEVFNRTKLSKDIDTLTDFYGDKGYAYVDVKPQTRPNPEKKTVDVVFEIKKNDLVHIERIDLSGNTRTRDKVIRRELEIEEGGLFSSSDMKKSRNNLRRLGYFEDVKITQTQGSASDKIKLNVGVKERPTGSLSFGMGFSSVDKLIATASISQSNFMGTGIKLDLSGTLSAKSSKYVLGVTEPWLFDMPISAGFDVYNTEKEYQDFKMRKTGFDLRFGFPITKRYTRGFVTYKLEEVNIFNVLPTAASYIQSQAGATTESSIRGSVRRDTRDDAFFPSEGSVENFSTEVAGGPLGGSTNFVKYEADGIKYLPLPWETTLSLRAAAGFVRGYGGKQEPIFERYYLGGINSVRGFKTRSLSPQDPATGDLIGGKSMFMANAEFLYPLIPESHLKGVAFLDAGNAYEGQINLSDLRWGAGVGLRWFSPIGPLRIELGFPLDRRAAEASSQFEFTIGAAF